MGRRKQADEETSGMNNKGHLRTSIRLESCAKTFADGTRALEPITLDITGGETVVFLGPSGCGKTTTLRIIAGLESPDPGGRIYFDDEDVTDLPIEKRQVGMVFQSYALFPNMNVEENIAYGLKIRKMSPAGIVSRVNEMLEMMHIAELRPRSIDQLSGGQRQRVALARAIAVQPRVLLLDEPLTALDALLRERLRVDIDRLLRELGITAVYVTHDQAEAMSLGDRIVVMRQGRVAQVGTPRTIYFEPGDPFVADFIGTMNRLEGCGAGTAYSRYQEDASPCRPGGWTAATPLSPRECGGQRTAGRHAEGYCQRSVLPRRSNPTDRRRRGRRSVDHRDRKPAGIPAGRGNRHRYRCRYHPDI
jgi:putative spermidine/putrescine transport system ATP-binding protein